EEWRVSRMFRPRGRCPRTPARGWRPWTPRSLFHGQRGSPPVTPPTAEFRPSMTPDTGEGGPKLPIPALRVEGDRGIPSVLRTTAVSVNHRPSFRFSRSTVIRPSASPGQPSFVLPPLSVNLHPDHTYSDLRDTYVRWGSRGRPPRRNSPNVQRGCRGRPAPC